MTIILTREAAERAQWVVQAAEVLHRHASTIAHTCAEAAGEDAIIVAAVERDFSFGGVWTIPRKNLHQRILQLEDHEGKWVLIFAPMTSTEAIKKRCISIADLAYRRRDAIQRRLSLYN